MLSGRDRRIVAFLVHCLRNEIVIDRIVLAREEVPLVPYIQRAIKSTTQYIAIDVPFAAVITTVTGWLQIIRQQSSPRRPLATVATLDFRQRIASHLLRIVTGQQRGSARPTSRRIIKLCKSQSIRSQSIQVGRRNLTTVTTHIRIPQVIGNDHHDIRRRSSAGWRS